MTTQIISGIIAQKVGGKRLILVGLSLMAVLTLLTPIITVVGGFGALFAVRLLEGMCSVCDESTTCFFIIIIIIIIIIIEFV